MRFGEGFFALGGAGLLRFVRAKGLVFLVDAGNGVEEELREVAEGESVVAADALASEGFGDVGEERVDAVGGVEIAGGFEKFGGENFRIGLGGAGLAKVIGAERFRVDAKHAAMLAAGREVLALIGADEFGGWRRHESSFR